MNETSLKDKIKNIAKEKNVTAQSVLQNYLQQRFLLRLSKSKYKNSFIVKGGMLISNLIGIEQRTTMDLDITIINFPLTIDNVEKVFNDICNIQVDDQITFVLNRILPIRPEDEYEGYRISYNAVFGKLNVPMSIDISTGDVITPGAITRRFFDVLDENISFELLSYSIETVMAEKIETVLSRSIGNTRLRDFYDIYKLSLEAYDIKVLKEALKLTTKHRNSNESLKNYLIILQDVINDSDMNIRWKQYSKDLYYTKNIKFEDTVKRIKNILDKIQQIEN